MERLIAYLTKYSIWSNGIILIVLMLGGFSIFNIKKAFFPEVDPNTISVTVVYPGASPEEMEEGVVIKVEEALKSIQGIEEINSKASENTASISVSVKNGYESEIVLTDVKNAVDRINSFPESAERPIVINAKPRETAISLILVGDLDLMNLKKYAETMRYDLLASGIISEVTTSGYPTREIAIEVPEETLIRYGMTFDQVANAVRLNNRDISSGSIKTENEEILIRSRAKQYDPKGLGEIIVRTNTDGSILRLSDIASIKAQFSEVPNKRYFNGKPAVTINVIKFPEENILTITDYVRAYAEEFNDANQSVEAVILDNRADYLNKRLDILTNNGLTGLILVLVFLGLFLNLRLSFWVAFGIPFSFLGMLFIADYVGVTINIMSLFGMILVIGILVDDGIVVGENIYAHFEKGKSPFRSAVDGTMEVMGSVFTGVSTTILSFSLFFFFEGRFGAIVKEMAVVVILCLIFSLIECYFVLPAHLAHSGALDKKEPSRFRKALDKGFSYLRDNLYGKVLANMIRYRYPVLAAALAMTLIVTGLVQGNYISSTFFPPISFSDNMDAAVVLKPGTRENITEGILKRIEQSAYDVEDELQAERGTEKSFLLATRVDVGTSGSARSGINSGSHLGNVRITLAPQEETGVSKSKYAALMRQKLGPMPEVEQLTIGDRRAFGKAVSLSLKSRDSKELELAKLETKSYLKTLADLRDITDNNIPGNREINLKLKPQAYLLGLTHNDITRQIRQGFFGEEAQRLQIGQDEVRVWVRYPRSGRRSLGDMDAIKIRTAAGQEYPLTELVEYDTKRGVIDIVHLNGAREVRVEADLADQSTPVAPILTGLQEDFVPKLREKYSTLQVSFEGQSRRGAEFGASLGIVAPFFLVGMVLLIALGTMSFSQSILIISMIPLGLIGAVIGHGLEGKPVSILSSYGMLALAGVIVNDAVVFIDKFNRFLRGGHSLASAIFYAGKSRFRPIILTSLTTVVGLFPLIRDTSQTAQFLIPMAISVAYGVMLGTAFILTIFPSLLAVANDVRIVWGWLKELLWHGRQNIPLRELVEPAIRREKKLEKIL
ncbi:MAG: efflux RND transporter permease subunit [Bacteroidia bacterium]|nr:efflux RND transporter permease subunit [Bacteroidia bacterium]